jgi:hypothetical protein
VRISNIYCSPASDRSCSLILEEILISPSKQSPVVELLGMKETILVAGLYIWWQRREALKGESVANAKSSAFSIHAITANYGEATHATAPKVNGWTKPPPKTYKLNVDASFFSSGIGTAAAVIRNSKGEAIAGGAWPMANILDASTAEAMSLKIGLELLENIQCSPTIVESDNLEVVNACNGDIEMWTPNTAILMDCFQIL